MSSVPRSLKPINYRFRLTLGFLARFTRLLRDRDLFWCLLTKRLWNAIGDAIRTLLLLWLELLYMPGLESDEVPGLYE